MFKMNTDRELLKDVLKTSNFKKFNTLTFTESLRSLSVALNPRYGREEFVQMFKEEVELIKNEFRYLEKFPRFEVSHMSGLLDAAGYTISGLIFDINFIMRDILYKEEGGTPFLNVGMNYNLFIRSLSRERQRFYVRFILLHEMRHVVQLHNGIEFPEDYQYRLEHVNIMPDHEVDAWVYCLERMGFINE